MNNTITMYKTAAGLLLIISIVLGFFLYQEKTKVANESLSDSISLVEECNASVTAWRAVNGNSIINASEEAKAELETILTNCSASFE